MKNIFGLPIGIGSLPFKNPATAVALIANTFPNSPYLPELPQRSFREAMGYLQSENFPGLVEDETKASFYFSTTATAASGYEQVYEDYLNNNINNYGITRQFAAGWEEMFNYLKKQTSRPTVVKGQFAGPITYGHILKDEQGKPIYANELVFDVLKKFLILRARWLVQELKKYGQHSLIFFDEPLLQSIGTALLPIERHEAINLLKEILAEVEGLKGAHCCGNTDWSILTEAGFNIIHFDAFTFTPTLALYPEQVNKFLNAGGILAWGIVPSSDKIKAYQLKDLIKLFQEGQAILVKSGVSRQMLKTNYLVSSSCGLGSLSIEVAEEITKKTASLAAELRAKKH